jgi:molybdopterin-containing oxidoreductase family membrane subunit
MKFWAPPATLLPALASRSAGRSRFQRDGVPLLRLEVGLWNSALLAPRFIASAFITGPAFVIVLLYGIRRVTTHFRLTDGPIALLASVLRITILVNLFMFGSEVFTEFYTGGAHAVSARYLFFGLHGKHGLVPWIWAALLLNVTSAVLVHSESSRTNERCPACAAAFGGVWIEKGMGLIVPGFVPSTLHELVEYSPSLIEWRVSAGVWALGAMVLITVLRITLPILSGQLSQARTSLQPRSAADAAE